MAKFIKVKLQDIDLRVSRSTVLIIEIDVFKFTKQDDCCFVTIETENQGEYEFLDEIHLYEDTFNIDSSDRN